MASILQARGLAKVFGGFRAVDGIDLDVETSAIHAVIGPNGAGKTTFFNLLTGHLRPTHGSVRLEGTDITGKRPDAVARLGLARAFQVTNVFPRLSAVESVQCAIIAQRRRSSDFLSFFHRSVRREALATLESVGLAEAATAQASTLSHGDQRALEVALALATAPKVLLLDEPTAGMSPYETQRMVSLVRDLARGRDLTVLFCEHDMDVVFSIADTVTVLHQGQVIAEGDPERVRRDKQVAAVYLGAETEDA